MHTDYDKELGRPNEKAGRPSVSFDDIDLDEVMALLEKDYTKPQPPRHQADAPITASMDEDISMLKNRWDRVSQQPAESSALADEVLYSREEVQLKPKSFFTRLKEKLREEFQEKTRNAPVTHAEEAEPAPAKKWPVIVLGAVVAVQIAGLVAIGLWWMQWL